jgi:hypothetical protein
LSGLLLTVAFLLTTNLPAMAGQSARDGALFAEPRLGSTPFNQGIRPIGNPDSTGWFPERFAEPGYLTGMSTRLLAKNGAAPEGGAASAPAAPGGHIGSKHGSLAEIGAKLSNPAANVWAMFTQFGLTASDGDIN